jgi:hypothetical protein
MSSRIAVYFENSMFRKSDRIWVYPLIVTKTQIKEVTLLGSRRPLYPNRYD